VVVEFKTFVIVAKTCQQEFMASKEPQITCGGRNGERSASNVKELRMGYFYHSRLSDDAIRTTAKLRKSLRLQWRRWLALHHCQRRRHEYGCRYGWTRACSSC
jgi:hypothetical protein